MVVGKRSCINGSLRVMSTIYVQPNPASCVRLMHNRQVRDHVRLMCQMVIWAKHCLNGVVREVSIFQETEDLL